MAMTAQLKKIVSLLSKGSTEEAIAAAVVLGALAPKEKAVVAALAKQLDGGENLPLALASARALGRIGNAEALKALLPLLEARGELRDTGALAIAGCGRSALPAVKRALAGADFQTRGVLIQILVRLHTPESLRLVLDSFFDPNFELVKLAGRALRQDVAALSAAERKAAAKTTLAFLKSKPVQASRPATNSALIYLGALAQTEAVPVLLKHTGADRTRATRRHALGALRNTLLERKVPAQVIETVFPYLDDPDFEAVVEPSLGILEPAMLPARFAKELKRLIGGRFPPVRQFAVRKLAAADTKSGAETLVALLEGKDELLRRSVVHALKLSPKAPAMLLPRLIGETDPDRAWELVHLIKPNADQLGPPARKKLAGVATKLLDKGDRRAESLLHLYRHADPKGYYKTFHDRALKAKRARRYGDAERDLRLISKSPHFDADARFQLGLMMLKAGGKDLSPTSPKTRQALDSIRRAQEERNLNLEMRIKKESRMLGPEGLYALGFGLIEGRGRMRELGTKLLRAQVKKGPRTKTGRMARAKLETEGLL